MHSILFIFILHFFYYPVDGKIQGYFESGYHNIDDRTMLHPDLELKIQIIRWIKGLKILFCHQNLYFLR